MIKFLFQNRLNLRFLQPKIVYIENHVISKNALRPYGLTENGLGVAYSRIQKGQSQVSNFSYEISLFVIDVFTWHVNNMYKPFFILHCTHIQKYKCSIGCNMYKEK